MKRLLGTVCLTASLAADAVHASDPPASAVNPVDSEIETVETWWGGTGYDIRHTDPNGGQSLITVLSTHADTDRGARILINPAGDTWVAWWRDGATDEVLYRKRASGASSWSLEEVVSPSDDDASRPHLVWDGTSAWIVFVADPGGGADRRIRAATIFEDPVPFGVASTSFAGDLDPRIHHDDGHLWVTWVDSSDDLGWSEYDYASRTWGTVGYEGYAQDSVEDARARVAGAVLTP